MSRAPTEAEKRAAIALCTAHDNPPNKYPCEVLCRTCLQRGRAVIRSLYEPDEAMLAAYMAALEQPADPKKEPWHKAKMRKRWRAMIDAASPP